MRILLIADDDQAIRDLNSRVLKRAGYQVVLVENADQAYDALKERPDIDGAFMDDDMPGKVYRTGVAVLQQRRKEGDIRPVTIVSGTLTEERKREILALDGGFLDKPLDTDVFKERARYMLEKPVKIEGSG